MNTPAGGHTSQPPRATYNNTSGDGVTIVISEQPQAMHSSLSDMKNEQHREHRHHNTTPSPDRPAVIAMPPPPEHVK
jgi:hypothetical protein